MTSLDDPAASAAHFARIYAEEAERYDRLVRAEDHRGELAVALHALLPVRPARVLDVGAGTGRVARLLGASVAEGVGVEPSDAMRRLAEASAREVASGAPPRWRYVAGDARALPVASARFDVGIAAWVYGHLREWHPATWEAELAAALAELRRAVRPGGLLVVVDTLGTGTARPAAPSPGLAEYHAWLEDVGGLSRAVVRTDYRFASRAEATELVGAFFGASMVAEVREADGVELPECTGIWSTRLGSPRPAGDAIACEEAGPGMREGTHRDDAVVTVGALGAGVPTSSDGDVGAGSDNRWENRGRS